MTTDRLGPYLLGYNDTPECGIYTGDARELAWAIPNESVDLIFTDPVYQNIDDYRWLAETAARVLKDDGNCLAQVGQFYLPAVCEVMSCSLTYNWTLCEFHRGKQARMWSKRLFARWKPTVWYTRNGNRQGGWCPDVVLDSGQDKTIHEWGDNTLFFEQYVRWLAGPKAIILDPFTGGGTVPAVCKMLSRRYLAFEIDPATADKARQRVRQTQPPLFVPEAEQAVMF